MISRCLLPFLLLLLAPMTVFAQNDAPAVVDQRTQHPQHGGPAFLSVQDSLDFARFKERCAGEGDTSRVAFSMDDHRLVWREQHYGNFWIITRGSGQSLKDFVATEPKTSGFPFGSPPIPLGLRCMQVVDDPPTGLIQRDVWYFEAP